MEGRKLVILWKNGNNKRQGFLFLNSKAMYKMLFAISLGQSLLILLVPQWMMTYLRWFGTGKRSARQIICWVHSPPMPRFSDSFNKEYISKWVYINWYTGFLWSSIQCIFCERFVGLAGKHFSKPCFINKLSNIANLCNLSTGGASNSHTYFIWRITYLCCAIS